MYVVRSTPQEAHYHANVIYLLPYLGIKKGARDFWYSGLRLYLPINIPYTLLDNTPLHSIPSVWRPWGCGCGTVGKAHTTTNSYHDVRGEPIVFAESLVEAVYG